MQKTEEFLMGGTASSAAGPPWTERLGGVNLTDSHESGARR